MARGSRTIQRAGLALVVLIAPLGASAGPADVLDARARCEGRTCRFEVTVRHSDTGWDHYADAWEVWAPDGSPIATRLLRHPHVGEQPFTRALDGVVIPPGVTRVRIRARDSRHGHGGRELWLELAPREAPEPSSGEAPRPAG